MRVRVRVNPSPNSNPSPSPDQVDHDVSNSVPRAVDSATAIRAAAAAHAALLPAPEDSSAIEVVLGLLAGRA